LLTGLLTAAAAIGVSVAGLKVLTMLVGNSQPLLRGVLSTGGQLPNFLGVLAGAPAALLLAKATRELIRGQVEDLAFEQRASVTVEECLDMAAGKTGALMAASAAIGAVLAGLAAVIGVILIIRGRRR